MQAITRYVFNQLLAAALFITLGLTLAIWLSQSLRWISYIVNRGLPASTFLYLIGLLLPSQRSGSSGSGRPAIHEDAARILTRR